MSIHFICTCGKRLKARDEMAARRSVCPRCRRPVGIPSSHASQRGAPAGPLTPDERRRRAWTADRGMFSPADPAALGQRGLELPAADVAAREAGGNVPPGPIHAGKQEGESLPFCLPGDWPGKDAAIKLRSPAVPPRRGRKQRVRRRWHVETRWYESWRAPWLTLRWEFPLALALGLATLFVLLAGWPELADEPELSIMLTVAAVALTPAVLACTYLQCVLRSAVVGAPPHVIWPEGDLLQMIGGTVRWLVGLLVGPGVLLLAVFYYWLWCGDLDWLNGLILAELSLAAVGYGLFVLLAVTRGRLWDANPVTVALLVHALGPGAAAFAAAAWLLVLVHGWWALTVIQNLQPGVSGASVVAVMLILCWFSILCGTTFLLRLLGLWSCRKLGPPPRPARAQAAESSRAQGA